MTAKAETDEALEKHTDEKASATEELMGNGELLRMCTKAFQNQKDAKSGAYI